MFLTSPLTIKKSYYFEENGLSQPVINNTFKTAQSASFSTRLDHQSGAILVEFFGSIELKELVDGMSAVTQHPEFEVNIPACFDFTQAIIDVDLAATEVVFNFGKGLGKKRGNDYQVAFVYGDELTKTLLNFYRLFFARTKIDVDIFDNRCSALSWIRENLKHLSQ